MTLAEDIYKLIDGLPETERYGMKSQICRCAVSIPSNIAEGYGLGDGNYLKHIKIARGSLMELEIPLELCSRLKLLDRDRVMPTWHLSQEIGRMLTVLASRLKKSL